MGELEKAIRRECERLLARVPVECLPAVLPLLGVLADKRSTHTSGVAERFADRLFIMRRFDAISLANPGKSQSWVWREMYRDTDLLPCVTLRTLQWWIQKWNKADRHLAAGPASLVERRRGRPRKVRRMRISKNSRKDS